MVEISERMEAATGRFEEEMPLNTVDGDRIAIDDAPGCCDETPAVSGNSGGGNSGGGIKRDAITKKALGESRAKWIHASQRESNGAITYECCGGVFGSLGDIHRHLKGLHSEELEQAAGEIIASKRTKVDAAENRKALIESEKCVIPIPTYITSPRIESLHCEGSKGQCQVPQLRVLLFYRYGEVCAVQSYRAWLLQVAELLCLTGKLRVAAEGLNGSVAGTYGATALFMRALTESTVLPFVQADFKESIAQSLHYQLRNSVLTNTVFDGLSVRIQDELVPVNVPRSISEPAQTGIHCTPAEFHSLVQESIDSPETTVLIDCRNDYEYDIGHFEGAQLPPVRRFAEFPAYIDQVKDSIRDKKVLMYCTGGIRCERATSFMKSVGIDNVYQLTGGIHKYIEQYPDGHYKGKLFVFDNRGHLAPNNTVIGHCRTCSTPSDTQIFCKSVNCKIFIIVCSDCQLTTQDNHYCCTLCKTYNDAFTALKALPANKNKKIKQSEFCPCRHPF